ncbi:MAG: hypothetical protein AABM42_12440 [Actinomycetota bacterium]
MATSVVATGCVWLWPSVAGAQPVTCGIYEVKPASLTIQGTLADAESFAGVLHVVADKDKQPFVFAAGNLASSDVDGPSIRPSQIDVANPGDPLPAGEARTIRVSVKNVRFAGEYVGALELAGTDCQIGLTLVATGAPELSLVGPADKPMKINLVQCRASECWGPLDDWFTDDLQRRDSVTVEVANVSQSPVTGIGAEVGLRSEPGELIPPTEAVMFKSQTFQLGAQAVDPLPEINVSRVQLEPGHYIGSVYLALEGAEKRTVLPLEIDVKSGPVWAIVALVLSLLVQFLVWVATRHKPRKEERDEVNRLRKKLKVDLRDDWRLFQSRLAMAAEDALHGDVKGSKGSREAIVKDAALVEQALVLEEEAREKSDGTVPSEIKEILERLRSAAAEGEHAIANDALTDLRRAVGRLRGRAREDEAAPAGIQGAADRGRPGARQRAASPGRASKAAESALRMLKNILALIAGALVWLFRATWGVAKAVWHGFVHAVLWLSVYVLPWMLRALLVIFFVLAGLKELYLDNTTFGADPALDYSALFLWGLSATAVNVALGKIIPGQG